MGFHCISDSRVPLRFFLLDLHFLPFSCEKVSISLFSSRRYTRNEYVAHLVLLEKAGRIWNQVDRVYVWVLIIQVNLNKCISISDSVRNPGHKCRKYCSYWLNHEVEFFHHIIGKSKGGYLAWSSNGCM